MPAHSQAKPAGRGCIFYGCLSLVVLVLVLLLTGYLTIRYVLNTGIEAYTDSSPEQFEPVAISQTERDGLLKRVGEFNEAKGKTNQPVQLTLTDQEINALIAEGKDNEGLRDRVRVKLNGDELMARATIPLEQFSGYPFMSHLKGRHLNISFGVGVALEDGIAKVEIVSAEVKGTPMPKEILDALKNQTAFQKALNNPEIRKKLNQLDWIKIKDGHLQIGTGGSNASSN